MYFYNKGDNALRLLSREANLLAKAFFYSCNANVLANIRLMLSCWLSDCCCKLISFSCISAYFLLHSAPLSYNACSNRLIFSFNTACPCLLLSIIVIKLFILSYFCCNYCFCFLLPTVNCSIVLISPSLLFDKLSSLSANTLCYYYFYFLKSFNYFLKTFNNTSSACSGNCPPKTTVW